MTCMNLQNNLETELNRILPNAGIQTWYGHFETLAAPKNSERYLFADKRMRNYGFTRSDTSKLCIPLSDIKSGSFWIHRCGKKLLKIRPTEKGFEFWQKGQDRWKPLEDDAISRLSQSETKKDYDEWRLQEEMWHKMHGNKDPFRFTAPVSYANMFLQFSAPISASKISDAVQAFTTLKRKHQSTINISVN